MQFGYLVLVLADRFKDRSMHFFVGTAGATSIEYSIIAAMISVAIIGGVSYFGTQLSNQYLYLSNIINPQLNH